MTVLLIFLLTVSQLAITAGSSLTGYVNDDSSDVTEENGSCFFKRRNVDNIEDISWYEAWSEGNWGPILDPAGILDNHYAFSWPRMVRFGFGLNW
ncbi:MAG: hypothetical protein KAT09_01515 [Candidatus Aegiribacteria sp.]|nr:hypothetical protein [Candidatus Aegiribacteria sp.]